MPDDFEVASSPGGEGEGGSSEIYQSQTLGLAVVDLSDLLAEELGLEEASGVLIIRVAPGSLSYQAGLRQGMVIRRVGQKQVESVAQFKAAIENESIEKGITLELRTRGGTRIVTLKSS